MPSLRFSVVMAMIPKMMLLVAAYTAVAYFLRKAVKGRKMNAALRIFAGAVYGAMSVLSTHIGVDYGVMILNVRDVGPMSAGMFFDPVSGVIAGLIGGIERYIAGTLWGVGWYTVTACSLSTALAGFLAAFLNRAMLRGRKPSVLYAMFMGAVIEVFHMYVILLTHRDDTATAFQTIRLIALPMIAFTSLGLALSTFAVMAADGDLERPFRRKPGARVPVLQKFQIWLFAAMTVLFVLNYLFNYMTQSQIALKDWKNSIDTAAEDISETYGIFRGHGRPVTSLRIHAGKRDVFYLFEETGGIVRSDEMGVEFEQQAARLYAVHSPGELFWAEIQDEDYMGSVYDLENGAGLIILVSEDEVYENRKIHGYETLFADILVFAVIFVSMSLLVDSMVVEKIDKVNASLDKITNGDLKERVDVFSSAEFAQLSDDINGMVDALKGYIDAAEHRNEQELRLAGTIQDSALPKNFDYGNRSFEVFATMDPAKEVGGDFYDCFFVGANRLALVIADVSGKGIPAALFMMRSKTAIRGLAETGKSPREVLEEVNTELCSGNEADMFVTVWMGFVDLSTGDVRCVNAGHEYPMVLHGEEGFTMFRDTHRPPLGVMEGMAYTEYDLHLEKGDCLYVYTDGVPEAINASQEQYGTDRVLKVLNRSTDCSMAQLLSAVKQDMDAHVGDAEQFDDITMLAFRYRGADGAGRA